MIKIFTLNPSGSLKRGIGVGANGANNLLTPMVPAVRKLVICWPTEEPITGIGANPYLGIVEISWFDNLNTAMKAHEARSAREFLNSGKPVRYAARENVVIGPQQWERPWGAKLMAFISRKAGMNVADFQDYWRNRHAPIVRTTPLLPRYVQNHFVAEHYQDGLEPGYDGVAELWWSSLDEYRKSWASSEMQVDQFNDVKKFLAAVDEERGSLSFMAEEKQILMND
jgi:uncharacterized protein (TIGR02118 family)